MGQDQRLGPEASFPAPPGKFTFLTPPKFEVINEAVLKALSRDEIDRYNRQVHSSQQAKLEAAKALRARSTSLKAPTLSGLGHYSSHLRRKKEAPMNDLSSYQDQTSLPQRTEEQKTFDNNCSMEVEQQLVDSLSKQTSPLLAKHPRKQWNTQRGEGPMFGKRPEDFTQQYSIIQKAQLVLAQTSQQQQAPPVLKDLSQVSSQSQEPPKVRVSQLRNTGANFSQLNIAGGASNTTQETPFAILNLKKHQHSITTQKPTKFENYFSGNAGKQNDGPKQQHPSR